MRPGVPRSPTVTLLPQGPPLGAEHAKAHYQVGYTEGRGASMETPSPARDRVQAPPATRPTSQCRMDPARCLAPLPSGG